MKKFTVIHNFTVTASIEVLAETREEAFEKARRNELDLSDYDFELDNAEIGHEEDVPSLSTLIEKAEDILKEATDNDTDIILNPWPKVTTESWDGTRMEHHLNLMDNIFYNYDDNEIGFNTTESAGDFLLSELPEIEQLAVCQAIIKAAKQ